MNENSVGVSTIWQTNMYQLCINIPMHIYVGVVCVVSAVGPRANERKGMISNAQYLLNKAQNRVVSTSRPEAKTYLAPLILPKRENVLLQSCRTRRAAFLQICNVNCIVGLYVRPCRGLN